MSNNSPQPNSMNQRPVWRQGDFAKLWCATALSQLGTQITFLGIPLLAVEVLQASALEASALYTLGWLPFLLVSLSAGVWVDRQRRRPFLIGSDTGRALVLLSIPAAYALGMLSIWQLYAVVFTTGVFSVFFDVAYQSYLPSVVERDQLVEANAALEVVQSGARIAGPSMAGGLIALLSAPIAIVLDVVSYLVSAVLIMAIRRSETPHVPSPQVQPQAQRSMVAEIRAGLRYVLAHPLLRPLAFFSALSNFGWSILEGLLIVYAVRELHLEADVIGVVFSVGNLGLLLAATLAKPLTVRIGIGTTLMGACALQAIGMVLIASTPAASLTLLTLGYAVRAFGVVVYNINQLSLRQAHTRPQMLGRMNATMRFVSWGTIPLGATFGGVLATGTSVRLACWVGALLSVVSVVVVVVSPLRGLRTTLVEDR